MSTVLYTSVKTNTWVYIPEHIVRVQFSNTFYDDSNNSNNNNNNSRLWNRRCHRHFFFFCSGVACDLSTLKLYANRPPRCTFFERFTYLPINIIYTQIIILKIIECPLWGKGLKKIIPSSCNIGMSMYVLYGVKFFAFNITTCHWNTHPFQMNLKEKKNEKKNTQKRFWPNT